MKKIADVLEETLKVLASEKQFCQGAYARDKEGKVVPPCEKEAKCWCLVGAVRKSMKAPFAHEAPPLYYKVITHFAKTLPGGITKFNDTAGYDGVRRYLKQQIKALR